jgi:hypothetical protein
VAEDAHPVHAGKTVGQSLRAHQVAHLQEDVVALEVLQPMAVEPARELLVAVDVDLDREREPGLDLHVDQTELAVHEVAVELQHLRAISICTPHRPEEGSQ